MCCFQSLTIQDEKTKMGKFNAISFVFELPQACNTSDSFISPEVVSALKKKKEF